MQYCIERNQQFVNIYKRLALETPPKVKSNFLAVANVENSQIRIQYISFWASRENTLE